jgi:hypothetical protein
MLMAASRGIFVTETIDYSPFPAARRGGHAPGRRIFPWFAA